MEFGIYLSVGLFLVGSLISIFSTDIRQKIISTFRSWKYRKTEAFNKNIDEKIEFLNRINDPVKAIGHFSGEILLTILCVTLTLFFGFMLGLKVNLVLSFIGFFFFWFCTLIVAARGVETGYNLRRLEQTIERLEKSKK